MTLNVTLSIQPKEQRVQMESISDNRTFTQPPFVKGRRSILFSLNLANNK